jgi:tetratricopeptide (TPR) repeat protein
MKNRCLTVYDDGAGTVNDDTPTSAPWWRNDAVIFAALVATAVAAFITTYAITKAYTRRQDALARRWYQAGQSDLAAQKPKQAIADFRTALVYSRDNPQYRLRLAQALAADNEIPQAIAYFLNLWEEQPGNGSINLELARLYARERQARKAAQYYNNAIYGIWPDDPGVRRRAARVEYIQFLEQQNQSAQAQAEAVALAAATTAADTEGHLQAGNLLLTTGDPDHAFSEYTSVLKQAPKDASLGAGKAAFDLGRFHTAAEYLRTAFEHGADDPDAKLMLARADAVVSLDPWQRHISSAESAKRASTVYVQTGTRLQECAAKLQQTVNAKPPTTDLQQLYAEWQKSGAQIRQLARDPDLRDAILDLAFRVETTTAHDCGPPTSNADWALQTLSRYGEGVQR